MTDTYRWMTEEERKLWESAHFGHTGYPRNGVALDDLVVKADGGFLLNLEREQLWQDRMHGPCSCAGCQGRRNVGEKKE